MCNYLRENIFFILLSFFIRKKNNCRCLRSASTFSENSLRLFQPQEVRFTHFTHSIEQILSAIRQIISTIVLISYPKDAISSITFQFFEIHNSNVPLSDALKDYIEYLRHDKDRDRFFLLYILINDFGLIIDQTN